MKGYLVSKTHKNKTPTAIPMLLGLTYSMAIIFTSISVVVTPKINMVNTKVEVVLVWQVLLRDAGCNNQSGITA